ncbi:conserved hypothetical protein [Listeria ivanovii FSL F6-596]|nr:conserved hypothetical protein [Listeria ivanovii FSL F6-596]
MTEKSGVLSEKEEYFTFLDKNHPSNLPCINDFYLAKTLKIHKK